MAQYRNVLSWLETQYLNPAIAITKKVVASSDDDSQDTGDYAELKELEKLLDEALNYVRRHQN